MVFPDCPRPSPSRCRVDSSTAARCQQAAKTTWNLGEAQQHPRRQMIHREVELFHAARPGRCRRRSGKALAFSKGLVKLECSKSWPLRPASVKSG